MYCYNVNVQFSFVPKGPFNLLNQNKYFGGWPSLNDENNAIVQAFPVEGWSDSGAVVMEQSSDGKIRGEVLGTKNSEKAWKQALANISLDVDARSWPEVGQRDQVIKNLQVKYDYLRPILFNSPYEAAVSFIIGHRISIKQGRALRQNISQEFGQEIKIGNKSFFAFPNPVVMQRIEKYPGLSGEKIVRLQGVAKAALEGLLDRKYLRSIPVEEALSKICTIRGIGKFFAQGILLRGAGLSDFVTEDDITPQAIQQLYKLDHEPNRAEVLEIADKWKPYRMWATVLMHVWIRSEGEIVRRNTPFSKVKK